MRGYCGLGQRKKESLVEGEREAERLEEEGKVAIGAPSPEFYHGHERKKESGEWKEKRKKECSILGHLAQPHWAFKYLFKI